VGSVPDAAVGPGPDSDAADSSGRAASLAEIVAAIHPVSPRWAAEARARADQLAIPAGSLGRMLDLAVRLAAIQGTLAPAFPRKAVVVMAGDHGVVDQGVSAFPRDVTGQMVANFTRGKAAINALAGVAGAQVVIVDVGVAADLSVLVESGLVVDRNVRRGTADLSMGPAMTRAEALAALVAGVGIADALVAEGADLLGTGDMGIGNTTPSSCLACAFTGKSPVEVTGRGTGVDAAGLDRKRRVVERALELHRPDPADPVGVLAAVGGLEIAGIAGVLLGAAAQGVPVLVDGFISTAGALVACALAPACADYLVAAHRSQEPGHRVMLEYLHLEPLLDLDLRLGEGTGAALAMPLIDGAAALLRDMATFAEAQVSVAHRADSPAGESEGGGA
jgi:nicotinate-nucleotide--dimethylbenzimidazole phosphoribosyltransferase